MTLSLIVFVHLSIRPQRFFLAIKRKFQRYFKEVSKVFQGSSKVFQGSFKLLENVIGWKVSFWHRKAGKGHCNINVICCWRLSYETISFTHNLSLFSLLTLWISGSFKEAWRVFQWSFKLFQKCFKDVSTKIEGCLEEALRMFQGKSRGMFREGFTLTLLYVGGRFYFEPLSWPNSLTKVAEISRKKLR